jgi:hypothetical protein
MKKTILPLLALLLLNSCLPGSKKEAEKVDLDEVSTEKFTLRVPTYMSKASNLHEEATLQYQNIIKGLYCIVIEEEISEVDTMLVQNDLLNEYPIGLEGYAKLVRDQFIENVGDGGVLGGTPLAALKLSGSEGLHFEADAAVDGTDIHYHYGIVKGKSTYYQVLAWTILSKKEKHKESIMSILKSFKEK